MNPPRPHTSPPPALDSKTLFQRGAVVAIVHNGEVYHLRLTRQGKLILTK